MVFCQDCGKENSAGANFCESCGAKLLNTTLIEQDANKQKELKKGLKMKSTIVCENCGKIYTGIICPKCGTSSSHDEEEIEQEYKEKINLSIICENCGKIYKDSEVCPNCGTSTQYNEEVKKKTEEEIKKINEKKEQDYQIKKDERNKINEQYGFTNDEVFELYHNEAKQADKVYRAYVTYGISRIEKVNGRFLASQLIKLDVLSQQNNRIIQQNDEIIGLLKEIAENTK